ncbi:MAG: hypothetical protein GX347_08615 [Epulopiscium sp.]|nr:hypothetical protein [Candidatus Epulonipiscium sp.]
MNWTKVKNILIFLFLILNIVLGIYYYVNQYQTYTLSTERIQQIQQVLQKQKIKMDTKMVTTFYPMPKLKIELARYEDQDLLKGIFHNQKMIPSIESEGRKYVKNGEELWISRQGEDMVSDIIYKNPQGRGELESFSEDKVKKLGDQFVKDLKGKEGTFRLDQKEKVEDGYHLEYREVYKGWILFNSMVEIEMTEKGIVQGRLLRYVPMGFQGEKKEIYGPDEILLNFVYFIREKYPFGKISIVGMDLGYDTGAKDDYQDLSGIAVPYYRILLDTGEVYYINGYKNEIKQEIE